MSMWAKAALIRAIRTWAQAAIAAIGTQAAMLSDVNWLAVASTATLAAIISLLMSIAGLPEVDAYYANLTLEDDVYDDYYEEEDSKENGNDEVQSD